MTERARPLDVVLFGASGFVGRLAAAYLAEHAPAGVRVGLAGRSLPRLTAVRAELGRRAADWTLIGADAGDAVSLRSLARSTRVVVTTVGPYLRHGLPLVAACAHAGTDYADLAGEVLFVRRSIDGYHDVAARTGARIVHACGFDSVPSDLGVLLLAERARADGAGGLTDTTLVLRSARGGLSGGTVDSLRAQLDGVRDDPSLAALVADPYALSPQRAPARHDANSRDGLRWGRDPQVGTWTAPFVMAPYNTRIVRRSNALLGGAYGGGFRYREVMSVGNGVAAPVLAAGVTAGLALFAAGMAIGPMRRLLDRVLPAPGAGPGEDARRDGHFRVDLHAGTTSGERYVATVAASGDPGYAATAVMLGQSALCLALDRDVTPDRAGVLTPATALGIPLAVRLRAAGFELSVSRRRRAVPPALL